MTSFYGLVPELPSSEPYDAAILILVMHFLPDDGQKLELAQCEGSHNKPNQYYKPTLCDNGFGKLVS